MRRKSLPHLQQPEEYVPVLLGPALRVFDDETALAGSDGRVEAGGSGGVRRGVAIIAGGTADWSHLNAAILQMKALSI